MKKICFALLLITVASFAQAQNLNEKRVQYFVTAATKEFNLDKGKEKQLYDARMVYQTTTGSLNKQVKSGELTEEEQKKKMNQVNQDFRKKMGALTGKTSKELAHFYEKMRTELQAVK